MSFDRSLDSSIVHTTFSKSSVINLKIFSTTRPAINVSPFLASWFIMISTRVMYSPLLLSPSSLCCPTRRWVFGTALASPGHPLICLLKKFPRFFWRSGNCNLLKAKLIHNLGQKCTKLTCPSHVFLLWVLKLVKCQERGRWIGKLKT